MFFSAAWPRQSELCASFAKPLKTKYHTEKQTLITPRERRGKPNSIAQR
jgi:hypothetical protein